MDSAELEDVAPEDRSAILELKPADQRIRVGRFTYGNPRFLMWTQSERIEIGSFCSIADEVVVFGGGEHRSDWVTTFPLRIAFAEPTAGADGHPSTKGTTRIGNDVWLAYRAMVLSGVTIGDGAVVGAGSVVGSDVPPYAVVAGNPARVIRLRFPDDVISQLLRLSWWNWPIGKIRGAADLLCSQDYRRLLDVHAGQAGVSPRSQP